MKLCMSLASGFSSAQKLAHRRIKFRDKDWVLNLSSISIVLSDDWITIRSTVGGRGCGELHWEGPMGLPNKMFAVKA